MQTPALPSLFQRENIDFVCGCKISLYSWIIHYFGVLREAELQAKVYKKSNPNNGVFNGVNKMMSVQILTKCSVACF